MMVVMTGTTIVLNGASSAGKTTLSYALQRQWADPLVLSGLDTFLTCWPEAHYSVPGEDGSPALPTEGFAFVAGTARAPSWVLQPGRDGRKLLQGANTFWAAIAASGLDQVVDHVLMGDVVKAEARRALTGPKTLWVGVHCDRDELLRRETARPDRMPGSATGSAAEVHRGMSYDLEVDATATDPEVLAEQILSRLG